MSILDDETYDDKEKLTGFINKTVSSSTDGAEFNVWNDKYFFEHHFPKNKLPTPSIVAIRSSNKELIRFYCGDKAIYDGIFLDMRNSILGIRHPTDPTKYLFEPFMSSETSAAASETTTNASDTLTPESTGYTPVESEKKSTATTGLAENVTGSSVAPLAESTQLSNDDINKFWTDTFNIIGGLKDQGQIDAKAWEASSAIGIITMHCMKMASKGEDSAFRSMQNNLERHFQDIFKPSLMINLIPPSHSSLKQLHPKINAGTDPVKEILSLIIGRAIWENSENSPNDKVKGALYGSCLVHIGMHGLAPVKYVEQAALALDVEPKHFCNMICTKLVRNQVINVCKMLQAATLTSTVKIFEEERNLKFQSSWRFCRLYNSNHFNRFKTALNTRLIARCAAFISVTEKGADIAKMTILSGAFAAKIFSNERVLANNYINQKVQDGDAPSTDEAALLYATPKLTSKPPRNMNE